MAILFGNQKKWMLKGLGWFFGALVVLFTLYLDVNLNGTIRPIVVNFQLLAVVISIYQGIHNMNKPQMAYVQANDDVLSIYRSAWTPREKVRYDEIEDYYFVSTLFVLQLKNGKEKQFDVEMFSNDEVKGIEEIIGAKI